MKYKKLLFLSVQLIILIFVHDSTLASEYVTNASASVKTSVVRYIGLDTAIAGGVIQNPTSENIIRAGVCISKNPQPTINDIVVERSGTADSFTCKLSNLNMQQAYYIKAFVETSAGIVYGAQRTFATDPAVVGAKVNGGVLFYIMKPGDIDYVEGEIHGLIVADNFNTTAFTWRNGIDTTTNATDSVIGTGALNTQKIVAIQGAGNYAAKYCDDLVYNGYSDWYLPSSHELLALRNSKVPIGTLSTNWSSTEVSNSSAIQTTIPGKTRVAAKSQSFKVFAIRKF